MPAIILSDGSKAIVSACDFPFLRRFKWSPIKKGTHVYAACNLGGLLPKGRNHTIEMQRMVAWLCGLDKRRRVDHINRNGLDNRRRNLRLATHQQNLYNRGAPINSTSGSKGVNWHPQSNKWRVRIGKDGTYYHIGVFVDFTEAKRAYNKAARKLHGKFAFQHEL